MRRLWITWLACVAVLAAAPAWAGGSQTFGDYVIHYSALSTQQLTAEVAQFYRIPRSRSRGMLNVAVRKQTDDPLGTPVRARVEATATNLSAQLQRLNMREITERNAYYYIADFPVADREVLRFELRVQPEGTAETFKLDFSHQFFH
jgi:hypothetical protein